MLINLMAAVNCTVKNKRSDQRTSSTTMMGRMGPKISDCMHFEDGCARTIVGSMNFLDASCEPP